MEMSVLGRRGESFSQFGLSFFILGAFAGAVYIWTLAFGAAAHDFQTRSMTLTASAIASIVFLFLSALCWRRGKYLQTLGNFASSLPTGVFRVDGFFKSGSGILVMVAGLESPTSVIPVVALCAQLDSGPHVEFVGAPETAVGPGKFYLQVAKYSTRYRDTQDGKVVKDEGRDWRRYTFLPVPSNEGNAEG